MNCPYLKVNENNLDRSIRVIIGTLALVASNYWLGGNTKIIFFIIGFISLFTGFMGFCGLYEVLKVSTCKDKKCNKNSKTAIILIVIAIILYVLGSFASITITRKKFLEDFNHMNGYYKQTLFLTGQSKREEAKVQYDLLTSTYDLFNSKYSTYKPNVIKNDTIFNQDLQKVQNIIMSSKDGVYTGDLPAIHKKLEEIRPIFQEMFKRNGFSMLSMTLVDFHDIMETIIEAADAKDPKKVLEVYPQVNASLTAVENEDNSADIQTIRKNLEDLKKLAEDNKPTEMPSKAAELKASFIKVYLIKG